MSHTFWRNKCSSLLTAKLAHRRSTIRVDKIQYRTIQVSLIALIIDFLLANYSQRIRMQMHTPRISHSLDCNTVGLKPESRVIMIDLFFQFVKVWSRICRQWIYVHGDPSRWEHGECVIRCTESNILVFRRTLCTVSMDVFSCWREATRKQ